MIILILLILFSTFAFYPIQPDPIRLVKELATLAFIGFLFAGWLGKRNKYLAAFLVYGIVLYLYPLLLQWKGALTWKILHPEGIINLYAFTVLFCLLRYWLLEENTEKRIKTIFKFITIFAFVQVIYSIFQFTGHDLIFKGIPGADKRSLITGFMGHPSVLSIYLGCSIPMVFVWRPLIRYFMFIVLSSGFFMCAGRGGFLACIFAMIFFTAVYNKKHSIDIIIISAMIGILFVAFTKRNLIDFDRILIWKEVLPKIKNIIFGNGINSFRELGLKDPTYPANNLSGAHNEYLHFLLEMGLVGLSIPLVYITRLFLKFKKILEPSLLATISITVLFSFLLNSITWNAIHIAPIAVIGIISLATTDKFINV